jgi:parallel beta-helix repeat protein
MRKAIITLLILIITTSTIGNVTSNRIENNLQETYKNVIYVDDDNINGPWNGTQEFPYRHIKDGILNSTDEDIVYVFNGIYNETLKVNKSISLKGENRNLTIIDGTYNNETININKDGIDLNNFTIRNSGGYQYNSAIKVNSNNNQIKNCKIYRNKVGIFLNYSIDNEIDNCTFHTNGEGVLLYSSNNNTITGCIFSHNSIGVHLEKSNYNNISYCLTYENGLSFYINDSKNIKIFNSNVSDNSVNLGGIFIENSFCITIDNSILRHNGQGISISSSNEISITNCDIVQNTHYAITMRKPSKNVIVNCCEISNNLRNGIYIEKLNSCKIKNNNINNNKLFGIYSRSIRCNARLNWWGSLLGPSYFESIFRSRITIFIVKIRCLPWRFKQIKDIGANWEENKSYLKRIEPYKQDKKFNFTGKDMDEDGLPDWWEEKWGYSPFIWDDHANLDPDKDALNNFEECFTDKFGSNPFYRDIFLEIDWMESNHPNILNKPSENRVDELISIFKQHEIALHVDIGALEGGEEIPICDSEFSYSKLHDLYWKYFLQNDLNNPRKGIFHYGIICNYCPDLNFPFFGWDQFDSFAISAKWLKDCNPLKSLDNLICGALVHHLGHTLGLIADTHGGIDNIGSSDFLTIQWFKYRNYKSCMNYRYKYNKFTFSDGSNGIGDFNDWKNLDFSFFKETKFYNHKSLDFT